MSNRYHNQIRQFFFQELRVFFLTKDLQHGHGSIQKKSWVICCKPLGERPKKRGSHDSRVCRGDIWCRAEPLCRFCIGPRAGGFSRYVSSSGCCCCQAITWVLASRKALEAKFGSDAAVQAGAAELCQTGQSLCRLEVATVTEGRLLARPGRLPDLRTVALL